MAKGQYRPEQKNISRLEQSQEAKPIKRKKKPAGLTGQIYGISTETYSLDQPWVNFSPEYDNIRQQMEQLQNPIRPRIGSNIYQNIPNQSGFTDITDSGNGRVDPMANKFKQGDIVTLNTDMYGAPAGTKARVVGHETGRGYVLNFQEFTPGWSSASASHPAEILDLWVEEVKKERAKIEFDSVIIEDYKRDQIKEALEQVNQSDLIFNKWGFGETMEKGKGVSMLFWGPPGTGKTLMAQAIADHMGYKLQVVATADIESSAPGEAERNIRKVFKEAKGAETILLFDECDGLLYDRTNVGAIMGAQTNELLTQIEKYEGVTLFTTNRLGTLDEAMNRRLALKLEFGLPTEEQRVLIWQRMFPKKCPVGEIDWLKLATVELAGGYIKNAVLRAARMAAIEKKKDKEKQITMEHLIKSLEQEGKSMLEFDAARKKKQRPVMGELIRGGSHIEKSAW